MSWILFCSSRECHEIGLCAATVITNHVYLWIQSEGFSPAPRPHNLYHNVSLCALIHGGPEACGQALVWSPSWRPHLLLSCGWHLIIMSSFHGPLGSTARILRRAQSGGHLLQCFSPGVGMSDILTNKTEGHTPATHASLRWDLRGEFCWGCSCWPLIREES